MLIKRICPVCKNDKWEDFLKTSTNKVMTSDQRIRKGNLHKSLCKKCGTVCNSIPLPTEKISKLYKKNYDLNVNEGEEHYFFTSSGPIARSEVYVNWVLPYFPENYKTLLEVGCGAGNVLQRLVALEPLKKMSGIEGSSKACNLAREKGLSVQQGLILNSRVKLPYSDVILAIGVMEHLEDPSKFLLNVLPFLNDEGRIIFCIPIQNYCGYDVFFADHIWHFTFNQFYYLLIQNGLKIIHYEIDHPINHGFGLFVCQKAKKHLKTKFPSEPEYITRNRDIWMKNFNKVNNLLVTENIKKLAVFGGGEVLSLLMAYTDLSKKDIKVCLDEDESKIGTQKHGIKVRAINWLKKNKVDGVFLAVNPKYHSQIIKKLSPFRVKVFSIFE